MTEDQLLTRAQLGGKDALVELCRREWPPVYGVVYQAVGNPSDAITGEVLNPIDSG